MSSARILQARIEEISSAIEHQKQVLRDLETSRSNVRRELNAILDPMVRLPVEISSDIFVRCLPDSPRPHSGEAPMLFLNICHIWSDIAISTPALWTSIHCNYSDTINLELWLGRAKHFPLAISLHGGFSPDVAAVVEEHAPHVQALTLEYQHLKQLLAPFPSLTKMKIANTKNQHTIPPYHCLDALRAAPALMECEFLSIDWPPTIFYPDPLTHPYLRHLRLAEMEPRGVRSTSAILQYLTLPALETLFISDFDFPAAEFASFLSRSSPPLQSLYMATTHFPDFAANRWLRLVPRLADLTLNFKNYDRPEPFIVLELMASSGQDILPNIRNLRIHSGCYHGYNYDMALRVLTARRTLHDPQMQSFALFSDYHIPKENVIVALRELARDGMHIHIGPRTRNYI
ncbi:F-box domain-containing protein [Mycena sanguinolenta]|uniref:F-box domain-containing protein n=1 Tax=Mycena sanguinolenta TaxID=230812 RepID=A0A8H7CTX2_9AGAR|nr:F-box domain-containing protein [Mycena sanguinolenta]